MQRLSVDGAPVLATMHCLAVKSSQLDAQARPSAINTKSKATWSESISSQYRFGTRLSQQGRASPLGTPVLTPWFSL